MTLDEMLVKPVQRICRYPILLKQLLSLVEGDEKSRASVENALKTFLKIVNTINEKGKEEEDVFKLLEAQQKIHNGDVKQKQALSPD